MRVELCRAGERQQFEEATPSGGRAVFTKQKLEHVTTVDLPPAMREPDAIFWGGRVFIREYGSGNRYVEGFVWTAPFPGVPGVDVQVKEDQDGGNHETANA
jgi:hypothetical protein